MRKPNHIQTILDSVISRMTSQEKLLPIFITMAARKLNLEIPEPEIQCLSAAILNSENGELHIYIGLPCALGETEEEVSLTINRIIGEFRKSTNEVETIITEAISEAVPNALEEISISIESQILEDAFENTKRLRDEHSYRIKMVRRLWGKALEKLDMMRHLFLEWDESAIALCKGSYSNPGTAFALNKLAIRAYEITGEIITLAQAGYADGALSRWRSLHEVCVIAMFLSKQSDSCAQMYLSHHRIEELRVLESDHSSKSTKLKSSDLDQRIRKLRKIKNDLIKKFGTAFPNDYGWASIELGRTRTTFRDLESKVGLEKLRQGYKLANSTIHAGSLGALTRISLGPTNVYGPDISPEHGCEVAIKYSAASLSMMIAELCLDTESADLLAMNMVIRNFSLDIQAKITKAKKEEIGDSPRMKILLRMAAQREARTKPRRTLQRRQ